MSSICQSVQDFLIFFLLPGGPIDLTNRTPGRRTLRACIGNFFFYFFFFSLVRVYRPARAKFTYTRIKRLSGQLPFGRARGISIKNRDPSFSFTYHGGRM